MGRFSAQSLAFDLLCLQSRQKFSDRCTDEGIQKKKCMERDDDAPSVHREKGAKSSSLFFSCLLKPFFKGVSIYILLPAGVSSNSVYYVLQFHTWVFSHHLTQAMRARARKKCREGHPAPPPPPNTVLFSLLQSSSAHALYFQCVGKKRRYYSPPVSTVCLWLAVQEGVSPHSTPLCFPNLYIVASTEGSTEGDREGCNPNRFFFPLFIPSHVLLFCSYHAEQ